MADGHWDKVRWDGSGLAGGGPAGANPSQRLDSEIVWSVHSRRLLNKGLCGVPPHRRSVSDLDSRPDERVEAYHPCSQHLVGCRL